MYSSNNIFWQKMIDKMNVLNANSFSKYDFLCEISTFFDIASAFIYEINHLSIFELKEYYNIDIISPPENSIDLKKHLGPELLSEFTMSNILICDDENIPLHTKLKEIFNAGMLIIIPILNQHYELAGIIGLSDRRKFVRKDKIDINTSVSVLSLLANRVKLEMFEKGIESTEKVLNNVLDHIGIDIYVNDYYTHDILYINKSMAAPYGSVEDMLGTKCHKSILSNDSPCEFCPQPRLLDENGNLNKTFTWDYERALDGSWFRVLSSSFPWSDGRTAHLVASVDITESKKNQILIEKLALFDYLTGLPNRRSLQDDIEQLINSSEHFYILFCDLNGFKAVNDSLGHNIGDDLLKAIASNLKEFNKEVSKAYRLGGDEFVLIIKDYDIDIINALNELTLIFERDYILSENLVKCGSSIGVSHFPNTAKTTKELLHNADMAMYSAKSNKGSGARFYQPEECLTTEEYILKNSVKNHCD